MSLVADRTARPVLTAALTGILVLAGCGGEKKTARTGPPPVPVTVAKAIQKTMPVSFGAIGHVEPMSTVAVRARIGGELLKVHFEEGQVVRAGQVLFTIDPRQYEAAARQAEAQLTKDEALLKKAELDANRYEQLVKQEYVTKEQYDQTVTNVESLRASIAADRATVDNARLQVAYCTITSPIAGRTGNLNVKTGNLVQANATQALVTINQIQPIYASFSVPAQYLPDVLRRPAGAIAVAAKVADSTAPSQQGTLTFVDNTVDPTTNTVLLKATFPNREGTLWPGQFVDVTVVLGEERDRVVVPAPAVQTGQQGQYVFVVRDDGTAQMQPVKVNRMDEHEAVIDQGVSAGETVVTDGQLRLVQGSRVEVKEGAAPAGGDTQS